MDRLIYVLTAWAARTAERDLTEMAGNGAGIQTLQPLPR